MNTEERAQMVGLLEKLCPLDLYKVSVYANTLLELHGTLAFRVENSEGEENG